MPSQNDLLRILGICKQRTADDMGNIFRNIWKVFRNIWKIFRNSLKFFGSCPLPYMHTELEVVLYHTCIRALEHMARQPLMHPRPMKNSNTWAKYCWKYSRTFGKYLKVVLYHLSTWADDSTTLNTAIMGNIWVKYLEIFWNILKIFECCPFDLST